MKDLDNEWQSFAIYGSEKHRHLILRLIIKPFINKYFTEAKLIADFYLELDVDDKNMLKFALLINDGCSLFHEFQSHFSSVIKKLHFRRLTKNASFNLVSGEYSFPEFEIPAGLVSCGIFNKISSAMLQKLGSSSINEGQLLHISLSLQLCWLKQKGLKNLNDVTLMILQGYRIRNSSEQISDYVNAFYESNKEILQEIFRCIFVKNSRPCKPKWIIDWLKQCSELAYENTKQFKDQPYMIELTSYYIPAIMNKQLGVSGRTNYIQMAIINRLLTDSLSFQ